MHACIVGGGVIGCAVALELRRLFEFDVTVIERHGEVGHGTTSASCAIVRRFYSQPNMIAFAQEGALTWANWGEHIGPLDDDLARFHRCGMLLIPPRVDDSVRSIVAEMRKVGASVDLLDADEVGMKFPFLDLESQWPPRPLDDPAFFEGRGQRIGGAVFERDAGYVESPDLATHNLRLAAEREGVRFCLKSTVVRVESGSRRRFVLTLKDGKQLHADVLINAAGPHSSLINRLVGVTLPLETRALQREVHLMRDPLGSAFDGLAMPIVGDVNGGTYFRPETSGRNVVVGSTDPECDEEEWVEDPDLFRDTVTEKVRQEQCLRMMKRVPSAAMGKLAGIGTLYDVTVKDWYPIVDKTDRAGYYVCIGTSGSSFKTSPVLGRLLASIIDSCERGRDVDREPLDFGLPRVGVSVNSSFLSRLRKDVVTTGTVVG